MPFYLRALLLTSLVTSEQVLFQDGFSIQIANPIPDQFVQIGAEYTYGLNRVFSGDDVQILANGLPDWLALQYEELGFYQINYGSPWGVAISGDTAFVANAHAGLLILNVSDPFHPRNVSTYSKGLEGDNVFGVAVSENILFVATLHSGVLILNVSDPLQPQNLSSYASESDSAYGVAVSGSTLFVANDAAGVLVLNVSDLLHPQNLSTYPVAHSASGVAVSGNTLYVTDQLAGLIILNVTDPSHPQKISNFSTGRNSAQGVTISGNIAFVASNTPGALNRYADILVLNVSDPFHPQNLSGYSIENGFVRGLGISGNYMFVANMNLVEILDLRSATLTGIPLDLTSGQTWEIDIIAHGRSGSLLTDTFQLTVDSYLPQLVKNTLTDQSIFPDEFLQLSFESRQLFDIPDTSFLSFTLEQVNHPLIPAWLVFETNPKLISTYSTGGGFTSHIALSGNTAFVLNDNALLILNISDQFHPQKMSNYSTGSYFSSRGLIVSNNTVFLISGDDELLILNVSDPFHPKNLSIYAVEDTYNAGVALSANTAFVVLDVGLVVLNVSDPSHPQKIGGYVGDFSYARGVSLSGNSLFVANGHLGLVIFNVSDPSQPKNLSTYSVGSGVSSGVAISGDTVFVANGNAGVLTLNVSDPLHPQKLGTYSVGSSFAMSVTISGSTLFVANGEAGVLVLNVLDPARPQLQSIYSAVAGFASNVAIAGNTAFVANGYAGLDILGISNRYTLKIKAKPSQADVGNYPLVLKAIDEVGASASIPFTSRVEGPPRVNSPMTWQYAQVGEMVTFNIPSDTFFDPNYDHLVFSLNATTQAALPSWLSFNKISVTLVSNQPDSKDRGTYSLRLTATDPRGGFAFVDFNLMVVNVPQVIPAQPFLLVQNRHFHRSIPLEAIFDGAGQLLNYNLSLPEQGKSGLSWLKYSIVHSNLELWGTPANITGSLTLEVIASSSNGYRDSTPIILSINPNYPPQVKEPIPSQSVDVGGRLDFPLPSTTFDDLNGDPLTYSVLADGAALPNWLTFSQEKESWHLIAEPGGWDTNAFSSRAVMIQITARDMDNATVTTQFNLNVGGTSTIGLLLRIGAPILSILALFQKRAAFLNRLCYNRYQKDPHTLEEGQRFSIPLSTPANVVGSIEVRTRHLPSTGCGRVTDCQRFFKPPINYLQLPFDALPEGTPLPGWMKYRKVKNAIEGILPERTGYHELVVIVKNNAGVVKEQFALKLEKNAVVRRDRPPQERKRVERKSGDLELSDMDGDPEVGYVRLQ